MATTFSSLDVPVETPEDFPVAHFSSLLEMTFRSKSVDEYKDLMYKMQAVRQHIVKALLSSKRIENPEWIRLLKHTHGILTDSSTTGYQREMTTSTGEKFSVNVKDEIVGLEKDIKFLELLKSLQDAGNGSPVEHVQLDDLLQSYHPLSAEAFREERDRCIKFLNRIIDSANDKDRKPIMITDWDGTMKDYCSQYATNLQPIYSAVVMAGFAKKCTQRTVVFSAAPLNDLATFDLTAGSLKNPGILNLTALPIDGPVVFSGSWGREWWQGDHRVVHNDGISNEEIGALDQVNEETVCKHVHPDLSSRYQEEVRARMKRVDPCKQILYFDPSSKLDVDVGITKAQGFIGIPLRTLNEILGTKKSFDKNDFLLFVSSNRGPFLHQSIGFYKDSSHAIFVGLDDENKKKEQWRNPRTQLNVSCPDIIHAAISHLLSAPKPGL